MNLLFMQNQLAPYGIPSNGLVALYDPWRDTYGRNILPAGSEDFQTGWNGYNGETITVTPVQETIPNIGTVTAYRIQGTGNGTSVVKYMTSRSGVSNPHTKNCGIYIKVNNGVAVGIADFTATGTLKSSNTWEYKTLMSTASNAIAYFAFAVISPSNILDIVVYQPQINIGQLYPYSPPAGLPQSLTDYSQRGNNAQLGSTAGADTNDPAWSGNGLVFGTDDYLKSSSPAFDDMPQFTCITVCKPLSYGGNGIGRLWDKASTSYTGHSSQFYSGKLSLVRYNTAENIKRFITNTTITTNVNHILGVSSLSSIDDSAVKIYVDNLKTSLTYNVAGTPGIVSDANVDLYIGNRSDGIVNFDGTIYCQLWYNRILSDAEYMQAYNGLRRLMNQRGVVI